MKWLKEKPENKKPRFWAGIQLFVRFFTANS